MKQQKRLTPLHDENLVLRVTHSHTAHTARKQTARTALARTHTQTDDCQSERSRRERRDVSWTKSVKEKKEPTKREKGEKEKRERNKETQEKKKKNSDRIPPHGFLSHTHLCCSLALVRRFSSFSPFWRFVGKRKGADEERIAKRWKKKGLK